MFQSSHLGGHFTGKTTLLSFYLEPRSKHQEPSHFREVPECLAGKEIHHRWIVEGDAEWFHGIVLGKVAGQLSTGMWYNIKYDGEEDIVNLNLQEDIDTGDIIIL